MTFIVVKGLDTVFIINWSLLLFYENIIFSFIHLLLTVVFF